MSAADALVVVRRQWNDWRDARVPLSALDGVHWDNESGGIYAIAPQYFLHGYISCHALGDQEFAHSCAHGSGPHRIKVCIIKKNNEPEVFAVLAAEAGERPPRLARQLTGSRPTAAKKTGRAVSRRKQ
jgi:hypothetical protein